MQLIEVEVIDDEPGVVELTLQDGASLSFAVGTDPAYMARLAGLLDKAMRC